MDSFRIILGFKWVQPILIIIGYFIADRLLRHLLGKVFDQAMAMIRRNKTHKLEKHEREARIKRLGTLKKLSLDILRIVLIIFAVLMFLSSIGINIMPVLTGVGIAGLAISLAAQNIIRDFLNGIFVIMEDHYAVGDVVKIGEYFGTVERFTLRTTHLTDLDGNYIIIPNGNVGELVNATKNWSQAKVVVGVSYSTDVRKALAVMEEVAGKLKEDYPDKIMEDASIQGILEFADSSINLRALIKTMPGEQWFVGREYRLRLKEAFDREGIVIPFPQRDVWIKEQPGSGFQKTTA
ncbi:MAG TPA: mechanosensitive ion channel family protein [Synergistaceae bacterium]|jgi:small conductance mechanosensitive channel|nr:MAG: MscS Mechanosensitive ion channel [Synergistales bacterium 53_16]KUL02991.1 MAG: MscS Mechanosensitive ion channel [Synergistales bacterium 54_9]HAA47695.1 mechanosensitive ion channel family protein [Synergistaceae bacterium]HAG22290.1 mechanosensitive ion channel family protein [Synergistaceae bacterium]